MLMGRSSRLRFGTLGTLLVKKDKRNIHDALCVARNVIRNNSTAHGSGAAEISCSIAVEAAADKYPGVAQYAIRAFADALDSVPMALAENSVLQPIETLATVKAPQIKVGRWAGMLVMGQNEPLS
ncbi:putative chaperonin Cpn60/TCP-1 family, groEL-like equatorial domain superfamily [Helianthus anomalus]